MCLHPVGIQIADQANRKRPTVIAFYGFQAAPNVNIISSPDGWDGWTIEWAEPLRLMRSVRDHHLHNPFGLHHLADRPDRVMHVDQFELSCRRGDVPWLVDAAKLTAAVASVHANGGTIAAYVGSPLVIPSSLAGWRLPTCSPGAKEVTRGLAIQRQLRLCDGLFGLKCFCWTPLIRFYVKALLDARVDRIGFDFSADFRPGSCMDKLVRSLIQARIEVMIEPWPFNDRPYPPVSWVVREQFYTQVRLEPRADQLPAGAVTAKIYRIVPNHNNEDGQAEIGRINTIRARHGEPDLESTQQFVDEVEADGHIPLVRARQLLDDTLDAPAT
jgi:hypothetical protein